MLYSLLDPSDVTFDKEQNYLLFCITENWLFYSLFLGSGTPDLCLSVRLGVLPFLTRNSPRGVDKPHPSVPHQYP